MLVINKGHDRLILTEYNGKKYAFRKGSPMEIDPKIYNNIILSGHVSAEDIVPYVKPVEEVQIKSQETIIDTVKETFKRRGRPRK